MSYIQNSKSPLTKKSYLFAVRIAKMVKYIECSPKEYGLINQIFQSGTAIGALVSEAAYAQSPADFISKLGISLKEASETSYWLTLLHKTSYIDDSMYTSMKKDLDEIIRIIVKTIKTTRQNEQQKD